MNRVLTLSLDGEFTFRLRITKDGKLARLEIKKFNDKDDKYKDAKTEYLGKVLKMSDLEKVLRESKEFDDMRPMSVEEFTNWLKEQYKKIFGDRYDDNLATESASKLIASNDDNIENAKREAESIIERMHRQNKESEIFDNLSTIKSLLCDAPSEVKSSFNEVVKYFDSLEPEEPFYVVSRHITSNGKKKPISCKAMKESRCKTIFQDLKVGSSGKERSPRHRGYIYYTIIEGPEDKSKAFEKRDKINEELRAQGKIISPIPMSEL